MTAFIEKILGIFVVVRDAAQTAAVYEQTYGIGPWEPLDLSDAAVPQKWVREAECNYQVKMLTCNALNIGLTLVEPQDANSVFAEFLRDRGPGVFHLLVQPQAGLDAMLALAGDRRQPVVQRGRTAIGVEFAHVDFSKDLGLVLEAFKLPT